METLEHLGLGFATACTPPNLLVCFVGVLLGTVIGVLPGIGPVSTIALLLPFTFSLSPTAAIIMLAGVYYGSQYGGSITAILVNLPGEASSTVTCLDGHAMARQGHAGLALAIAAVASFVGGTIGTLIVAILSHPMTRLAAYFEAVDYVGLVVCGLVATVVFARGSLWHALSVLLIGLALGTVGTDVTSGQARFTFGFSALLDGIGFLPVAIGVFGLSEIMEAMAAQEHSAPLPLARDAKARFSEMGGSWWATLRGTFFGAVLGVLPGGGPVMASFAAYAVERKLSKRPPLVGTGAVEGVAGPESANNAAAQTSFIPLLTLGLPANPVMALFLGALIVHGIQPGPDVIAKQPELFWGLIASMWIGNLMLLVLNLPLVGWWVQLLRVPQRFLLPATGALCCVGVYSLNHSAVDVALAAGFGAGGSFLRRLGCDPVPLLLGFILSRPLEENLNRALVFAGGDTTTFLRHPACFALLALAAVLIVLAAMPRIARRRQAASE